MNLVPATLENDFVRLEPFRDGHREAVRTACDAEPELWPTLYYSSLGGDQFDGGWAAIREQQQRGWRLPFAVIHGGEVVGLTTFLDIQPTNRTAEIGTTYYRPDVRGGPVNPACKRLLLDHAFARGAQRISFQVDSINLRSRAAMAKLGATQDGILRDDKITWTGRVRSSVIFSILPAEWPAIRDRLDQRPAAFAA